MPETPATRRSFLRHTSIAGASLLLPALATSQEKAAPDKDKPKGKGKKKHK